MRNERGNEPRRESGMKLPEGRHPRPRKKDEVKVMLRLQRHG